MHVEEKGMPVKNILQCCEASYCRIIPEPGSYMKKNVSYNTEHEVTMKEL